MKALIFNPYLNTLGGGERYTLSIAEFLLQKNYKLDLAWQSSDIKKLALNKLNINIKRAKISPNLFKILKKQHNLLEKYKITSQYDLIFFVSDGSIPLLFGKKNILHFQVPFAKVGGNKWFNQLKLKSAHKIICNSFFTKKIIDKEFSVKPEVLYPSFSSVFKPGKKEDIILSVGRFDNILHSKKQDILVKVFKELIDKNNLANWKLVLAGGVLHGADFINKLKTAAKGYPIEIKTNASFEELKKLYAESKIYWHAAGFGENLIQYPERAEHFGISVVEAMAAGCLPIVFKGGGLPEIIADSKNGFLFDSLKGLKKLTIKIASDENTRKDLILKAQKRAKDFRKEIFFKKLEEIIK